MKFGQSYLLWSFGIWQLQLDCFLYKFQARAVEPHDAGLTQVLQGCSSTVKLCQMAECCPAIIRYVSILRLDHVHQNDTPYKYLWYIAMKMNFGNKEGEDKTWPFNTITAWVNGQMKDFQQIINQKIIGVHCIPPPGQCWNVIAYFLFAQ